MENGYKDNVNLVRTVGGLAKGEITLLRLLLDVRFNLGAHLWDLTQLGQRAIVTSNSN